MEHTRADDDRRQRRQRRRVLWLWMLPAVLVLLVTVIAIVGVHLLEKSDSPLTSQLQSLTLLVVTIALLVLVIGALRLYGSIWHIQRPVWRWIAGGCHGKPVLPWITESKSTKTKDKRID